MLGLLKEVGNEFLEDDCPRMAAALAYYTAFSLAPMCILLLLLAGFFVRQEKVEQQIKQQAVTVVGQDGAKQVDVLLKNISTPNVGTLPGILSIVGLLFGATGVFTQLQKSLNDAWDVMPDPDQGGVWNFVTKRLLSLGMILALAFVLVVSLALSTVISMLDQQITYLLPNQLGEGAAYSFDLTTTVVALTIIFAAIFKILPDAKVRWRDVGVGAVLTAVLFVAGKFAMGWYLGSRNMGSTFGAAGSFALLLLWVYYSGMIVLFGAEFTQVWARRIGGGIEPEKGAVRVKRSIATSKD